VAKSNLLLDSRPYAGPMAERTSCYNPGSVTLCDKEQSSARSTVLKAVSLPWVVDA